MIGVPQLSAAALRPLYDDWAWQDEAACTRAGTELFFPPDLSGEGRPAEREAPHARRLRETRAKLVCATCPVQDPCREHALSLPEEEGVWGGLSPEELAKLRPGLVYVSLCAFSHVGPWASRRGFDTVVQNVSGITLRQGEVFPGAEPVVCKIVRNRLSAGGNATRTLGPRVGDRTSARFYRARGSGGCAVRSCSAVCRYSS